MEKELEKYFSKEALEKDHKFIKEWLEAVKNSPQTEFAQKIGARIVELIKRDPLSKELTKALESNSSSVRAIATAIEKKWYCMVIHMTMQPENLYRILRGASIQH